MAFWNATAVGEQLASIMKGRDGGLRGQFWAAHPIGFAALLGDTAVWGAKGHPYLCTGHARMGSLTPFIADAIQLIAPDQFALMSELWPGHDTSDCLEQHGLKIRLLSHHFGLAGPGTQEDFPCSNDVYYLAGRNMTRGGCNFPSDSALWDLCGYLLDQPTSSHSLGVNVKMLKHLLRQPVGCSKADHGQ
jgi:hypothetical protein